MNYIKKINRFKNRIKLIEKYITDRKFSRMLEVFFLFFFFLLLEILSFSLKKYFRDHQ